MKGDEERYDHATAPNKWTNLGKRPNENQTEIPPRLAAGAGRGRAR